MVELLAEDEAGVTALVVVVTVVLEDMVSFCVRSYLILMQFVHVIPSRLSFDNFVYFCS